MYFLSLAILNPTYAYIWWKTSFFIPLAKPIHGSYVNFALRNGTLSSPAACPRVLLCGRIILLECVRVLCATYLCMPNTLFQVFTKENLMPRLSALCQRYHRSTPTFYFILNSLTRFFYNLIAVSAVVTFIVR